MRKLRRNSRPLKQNSAPAATVSEKSTPDAATILSQLRARCKKLKIGLADLEGILEIIENGGKNFYSNHLTGASEAAIVVIKED